MIKTVQILSRGSETIHLQPSKGNWGIIALFSIMGLGLLLLSCSKLVPISLSEQVLFGLFATIFLVPCAVFG